jgi:hypothetical protein
LRTFTGYGEKATIFTENECVFENYGKLAIAGILSFNPHKKIMIYATVVDLEEKGTPAKHGMKV